jgi:hypothetical protein
MIVTCHEANDQLGLLQRRGNTLLKRPFEEHDYELGETSTKSQQNDFDVHTC